ncbi:DUF1972 domain-containing protein [Shewanella submarina]|uniref:DUF1972 domain-containing protein n=1 Tax=Shewanella submarina TaxID=2016376 RepID=A0ABV7GAK0_9GAMM|nr:DUF1972 domain-containing protein [Shewanella submarina]MCL1037496.1 DUF1972 domain-containing protein [Shewanella submarina]
MNAVAVVGTVGIPARYGGFESLVENLVSNRVNSVNYTVYCSGKECNNKQAQYKGTELKYINLKANGVQSIPYDIASLISCIFSRPDTTLILGVSGCIFLPIYRLLTKSKVITNIDGLEWKRDKWGKFAKWFLKFSEKLAVRNSDVVIADNEAIANYVQDEYGIKAEVIAYGGDHAVVDVDETAEQGDFYLGLCRIEPENNVHVILDSFSKSGYKLVFIGNWNNSAFGKELKEYYSKFDNIILLNPIYDTLELYKYRSGCKGYVHGHSAGGTNPSLVEAMHIGKPIFSFDCNFNRYSTNNEAIYFSNSDDLSMKISRTTDRDMVITSGAMTRIANEKYTWEIIARQYESLYK